MNNHIILIELSEEYINELAEHAVSIKNSNIDSAFTIWTKNILYIIFVNTLLNWLKIQLKNQPDEILKKGWFILKIYYDVMDDFVIILNQNVKWLISKFY